MERARIVFPGVEYLTVRDRPTVGAVRADPLFFSRARFGLSILVVLWFHDSDVATQVWRCVCWIGAHS